MIEIVRAEEKHVSEIGKIWEEFMDFHAGIDPYLKSKPDGLAVFLEHITELMTKPDENLLLMAVDNGHAVGYSLSMISKRPPIFEQQEHGLISDMAVTGSYQRKGIGDKMLMETIKWFRGKGIRRVELNVVHGNPLGGPFWEKHGFKDYLHRQFIDI